MKADDQEITWEEVEKYLQNDSYKEFLKQIPLSVFKRAASKENRHEVIKTVLRVLQKRDLENATEEYAQKITDVMQRTAEEILQKKK